MTTLPNYSRKFLVVTLAAYLVYFIMAVSAVYVFTNSQVRGDIAGKTEVWLSTQVEREILVFVETLDRYMNTGSPPVDKETLLLRFDILYSRVDLIVHGNEKEFSLTGIAGSEETLMRFFETLEKLDPMVQSILPDNRDHFQTIEFELLSFLPEVHTISVDSQHLQRDRIQAFLDRLDQNIGFLMFVLLLSLGTAGAFTFLAFRKNQEIIIALREVEETQERLSAIAQALPDVVMLIDSKGTYLEILSSTHALLDHDPNDLIGKTFHEILPVEKADFFLQIVTKTIESGQSQIFEYDLSVQLGNLTFEGRTALLNTTINGYAAVVYMARDITEQKRTEEALRRSQKMEAIGQLTGGVAHDFNNILGIIQGNLDIIDRMLPSNNLAKERVEKAQKGVKRAAEITKKLLGFSRKDPKTINVVVVNNIIGNIKDLIAKSVTATIKVETSLAADLWTTAIDPGDFEDAIINISLNARDAMPDGGILRIETKNKILEENNARFSPTGQAGEFVLISISDTGVGMSEEVQGKMLEPFYTTKETGKGTGLGLSMVYGFVERSGGHINVYSVPAKGTVINLYLPRANLDVIAQNGDDLASSEVPQGTEKILIVDDEVDLLDIASSFLRELGYLVETAKNADQALKVLRNNAKFDLLLCDVVMPGEMDGYQLAATIHGEQPALKTLLTSGFTKQQWSRSNSEGDFFDKLTGDLLNKPYNLAELAQSVRHILDRPE